MSTTDPVFVVALNYKEYLGWCRRKGVPPERAGHIYVRDVQRLRGLSNVRIVFVDNWRDREDWREIYNRALIVGRRP